MDDEVDEGRAALEKEAKELGWVPKEQFRGPEDAWRDADEFVARGREILPIVRANNRKLLTELQDAKAQLAELKGTLTRQEQTTKDLLEHQVTAIKQGVERELATLRAEKKAAIKDGDHDLAADLDEQIDATKEKLAAAPKPPVASPPPAPALKVEPWAQAFADENGEWLGVDKRKSALFQGIAQELFETTQLRAGALLEEAKKQTEAMLDKSAGRPMAKSEGGNGGWEGGNGGTGNSGGAKSFASLPPEAKAQCKAQEAKFVGESGKAFKTVTAWQKHYAESYFASQR